MNQVSVKLTRKKTTPKNGKEIKTNKSNSISSCLRDHTEEGIASRVFRSIFLTKYIL